MKPFNKVTYRLSVGKHGNIISIEDITQDGFHTCLIEFFLDDYKQISETHDRDEQRCYLLSFRSEDKIIFERSSITEYDLIALRMNGNATFLLVILFAREKRSNLFDRQALDHTTLSSLPSELTRMATLTRNSDSWLTIALI